MKDYDEDIFMDKEEKNEFHQPIIKYPMTVETATEVLKLLGEYALETGCIEDELLRKIKLFLCKQKRK